MGRKIEVKKRGNAPGIWFFVMLLRLFGLKGAYGLLYFVCLHYALFDKQAVSATLAYIDRRFPGCSKLQRRFRVYRLFVNHGKQLIDRYAAISGALKFDLNLNGYETLVSTMGEPGKGAILLTAHVGNWQMAMTSLKELDKTVHLLMRPEDNPAVRDSLRISQEQERIKVISPEQELGGAVEIMNALRSGDIVSIMGDRRYGFNAAEAIFLGDKARFPYSAFSIAAAAECPVIILFSVKRSDRRYDIDVAGVLRPRYEKGKAKQHQLEGWVQDFVSRLEAYTKENPYQCFLFHDVWAQ